MLEPMETLADGEQRKTLANSEERDCAGGFQSSSLMKAARFGQVDAIERALECTATNIDAVGADGRTALHIAAAEGQLLAVHALMSAGAGLDTCDSRGQLPLETAREAGHAHIVAALAAEQAKRDAVWRQITGAGSGAGAGCAGGLQDRMLSDLLAAKSAAGPSAAGSQECPF